MAIKAGLNGRDARHNLPDVGVESGAGLMIGPRLVKQATIADAGGAGRAVAKILPVRCLVMPVSGRQWRFHLGPNFGCCRGSSRRLLSRRPGHGAARAPAWVSGLVGMGPLLWCGLPFSKLAQVSTASSDALESVTA